MPYIVVTTGITLIAKSSMDKLKPGIYAVAVPRHCRHAEDQRSATMASVRSTTSKPPCPPPPPSPRCDCLPHMYKTIKSKGDRYLGVYTSSRCWRRS